MNYAEKHATFWRYFFFLSVLVVLCAFAYSMYKTRNFSFINSMLDMALNVLALTPLYGYVYQKPIAKRTIWQLYFWVQILILIVVLFFFVIMADRSQAFFANLKYLGLLVLFFVPTSIYLFAVNQYANHSEHLWIKSKEA